MQQGLQHHVLTRCGVVNAGTHTGQHDAQTSTHRRHLVMERQVQQELGQHVAAVLKEPGLSFQGSPEPACAPG